MHLTTLITCVDYADFLALTLERAVAASDTCVVITADKDEDTLALCARSHAVCVCTSAWWDGGAQFNKAAAMDYGIKHSQPGDWLLLLDADVVLPGDAYKALHSAILDPTALYGARRHMIRTQQEWQRYLATGALPALEALRKPPPGQRLPDNNAGMQGYFQLWNYGVLPQTMPPSRTAAGYDWKLARRWPAAKRHYFPGDFRVLHLGENRRNWKGRVTAPWDCSVKLRRLELK